MNELFHQMEHVFTCGRDELGQLALHPNWQIRYAAAVAIGERKDQHDLPILQQMLDIELERPLYSQPKTSYIGVAGDTSLAEQVKPFTVVFPYEVDLETQEAWKCRGRVKQAICFAIYEIGQAPTALLERIKQMVLDDQEDAPVRAAAIRTLGKVGDSSCVSCCEYASTIDEWCIRVESHKALGVLAK